MDAVLPDQRHAALFRWQERLQSSIDNSFGNVQDRLDASTEDRKGLDSRPVERRAMNRFIERIWRPLRRGFGTSDLAGQAHTELTSTSLGFPPPRT
jgi:hypothetical protein